MTRRISAIRCLAIAAVAFGVALVATTRAAPAQTSVTIDLQAGKKAGEFLVPLNKSQILRVDVPFSDLSVGNAEIADVLPLTNRSIYVLGKSLGSTNLAIYAEERELIAVVDLVVTYDLEALKKSLFDHLPNQEIKVRAANGAVILSGTVSDADKLSRALAIAERYAPNSVTNLLKVAGSQQVLLEVRVAEVERKVSKELGFDTEFSFFDGDTTLSLITGVPSFLGTFGTGTLAELTGNFTLSAIFDALEENELAKTLAEPNLVALSGDTASFLVGGEVPVPVPQDDQTVTVEFKPFGVGLAFTPTVLDDGLINLLVSPEVSLIDPAISITTGAGLETVGFKTRRAETTIELRDGQSFAIAGLIQNNFSDNVRQLPWLGDIPILGALFRSTRFQRDETELVIIVTPHLVKPAPAGSVAAPTDAFIPPSEEELFLFGRLEAPESGHPEAAAKILGAQGAGGIFGNYGHIIK